MPTFATYEAAMIAGLQKVPGISKVEEFAFDLSALALASIAPINGGILMMPLGGMPANKQPSTSQFAFVCRTSAYIIAHHANTKVGRSEKTRALAQQVMLTIRHNQWGLNNTHSAEIETLENKSTVEADQAGYAIWQVTWKQTVNLDDVPVDNSVLPSNVVVQTAMHIEQVLP